jgi:hypothetical protein
MLGDIIKGIKKYCIGIKNTYCIRIVRELIPKNSLRNNQLDFHLYQMEREYTQPKPNVLMKEILKKIRTISKEVLIKYWWVVLLLYTLKGIAALLFFYFLINA